MDKNEKTLRRIASKSRWSGADVGKVLLINWLNRDAGKKKISTENFSFMFSTLNERQRKTYASYENLKSTIEIVNRQIPFLMKEIRLEIETLSGSLHKMLSEIDAYADYLMEPLTVEPETFKKLISKNEFRETRQNAGRIISLYIYDRLEVYGALGKPKGIKDAELKAYLDIFDKYRHTPATVQIATPIRDIKALVANFAETYKTESTQKAVCNYILNELQNLDAFYNLLSLNLKNRNGNIKDIETLIEIFEWHERKKAFFYGKELKSDVFKDTLTYSKSEKKTTKLETLETFIENCLTAERLPKLKDEYNELYTLAKDSLSKNLPEFSKPDEELLTLEIPNRKLLEILNVNQLLREYLYTVEPTNLEEFVMLSKADNGIIVEQGTKRKTNPISLARPEDRFKNFLYSKRFWQEIKVSIAYHYNILKEDIKYLCNAVLTFNLLDALTGVDFSSLSEDMKALIYETYNSFVDTYNESVYTIYFAPTGDKKTLEENRAYIKDNIKPLEKVSLEKENNRFLELAEKCKGNLNKISDHNFIGQILNDLNEDK